MPQDNNNDLQKMKESTERADASFHMRDPMKLPAMPTMQRMAIPRNVSVTKESMDSMRSKIFRGMKSAPTKS